jgi:ABC-2 type transport system ATP-binding protein
LRFVAHINGVNGNLEPALQEALEAADIVAERHRRIGTLSGGYQRRVGIASTIVHRPALILLDEPTNKLDPMQIVHIRERIRVLRERHTILLSSHILSEVQQLCDRVLVIHGGKVVAQGSPDELMAQIGQDAEITIELEARSSATALSAALKGQDGLAGVTIKREADGVCEAIVRLRQDNRESLIAGLVNRGIGLRRFAPAQGGLEWVFTQLIDSSRAERPSPEQGADHA